MSKRAQGTQASAGERVVVGMSGGVDSSVAAALLVEQGFEVIGVSMHLAGSASRCCSLEDADDARRVAEALGIRFYLANYKDAFRREVIESFADSYLAGRTPIPCVLCNRRFKFHHLRERARALGAGLVATGHYARVDDDPVSGLRRLRRGRDLGKDQSYFLFDLDQSQLEDVAFPLGEMTKDEVRTRARALGLATADKPESQEICFVPDDDYAAVVESVRPDRLPGPGEIVNPEGRVLGSHPGIHHFTVGQRRGLGLTSERPLYVKEIQAARNRIVVGESGEVFARGADLTGVSWVAGKSPVPPVRARVAIRYRHEGAPARIEEDGDRVRVFFDAPERAVAPGQAAVFYEGDEVLGGGWIYRALA